MAGRILGILRARWFVTLNGAVILSLLIWFVGPLLALDIRAPEPPLRPFESGLVRTVLIAVVFLVWGLLNVRIELKRKQSERALEQGLTEAAAAADDTAPAEEVAILKERLETALDLLRRSAVGRKAGRHYLYQLPWYVIIGPPGSGKTTALVNSGLRFPLAEQGAAEPVRGVGGTRHCDWWFSDEAVLLDTAGRYTTQDSNRAVDSAGWVGFLGLLKGARPRQPINGAIVAISLAELASLGEAEVMAHARAVKQRLRELRDELGVRFPIYVLFTKADLIAGFVEFFDDLDREEREQVWGFTFELDDGTADGGAVADFGREYDALIERLDARAIERMHQEVDIERRSLIFGFPAQMASLKPVAERFLTEIFRPSRLEPRLLLRGVYFASGTQEGTPIDRLMGAMAASFGLDRQRLSAFRGRGRSYFINRMLRGVVFAEAGLVNSNRRVEARQRGIWYGAAAAMLALLVAASVAWFVSYRGNRALIAEAEAGVAEFNARAEALPAVRPETPGLRDVLPALDILRELPAGYEAREAVIPTGMTFGLYQGDAIGSQAVAAYYRALNGLLRPRLMARLEQQIRVNTGRPDYLFEALKVYLMLAGEGSLDKDLVRQWMQLDWAQAFPGDASEDQETREALTRHLGAMLERLTGSVAYDAALVEHARLLLSRTPLPERAYALIRQTEAVRSLPVWRLDHAAGPGAEQVLRRHSGQPLSEGVPGLYTIEGYYRAFRPALANVIHAVASESWVLGAHSQVSLNPAELSRLQQSILDLYLDDYIRHWQGLLSDLAVPPLRNLAEGADFLNIASSAGSPLRRALVEVARQTALSRRPEDTATDLAGKAAEMAGGKAAQTFDATGRLAGIVGAAAPAPAAAPEARVDAAFLQLHQFVGEEGAGPAPIDDAFRAMDGLYQSVSALATAAPGAAAAPMPGGGVPKLRVDPSWPEPVTRLLNQIQEETAELTAGGARSQINAIWKSEVLPACLRAIDGRYPFDRGSPRDVPIDDFVRVFAPGGLLDAFFDTHLRALVDTTGANWRWRTVDNVSVGRSASALAQLQRAAVIRQAFFPTGGAQPAVRFVVNPEHLDPESREVLLQIDGQTASHGQVGVPRQFQLQWPGPGPGEARITFLPPPAVGSGDVAIRSPWALFRLLDQSQVEQQASDLFRVTFAAGGRRATFSLRAGSVLNPFSLRELASFRCPPSL